MVQTRESNKERLLLDSAGISYFCFPGDDVLDSDNEEAVNEDQWEDIDESDEEEDQSPMDHS